MTETPPIDVNIRSATRDDLPALEALPFTGGLPSKHGERLKMQEDARAEYLLAIHDGEIVGHLLLKWAGPSEESLRARVPQCAEIEDFVVRGDLRGKGIGTRMVETAGKLAVAQGESFLGLGVGEENVDAFHFYEHQGFLIAPMSHHTVTWPERGPDGKIRTGSEDCLYMVKEVA